MLIVFEGPSGSGKTTLLRYVAELLIQRGKRISVTKFPSNQDIGLLCRKYAVNDASPYALACLIAADFYRGATEEIEPRLSTGACVMCDRYTLSTFVYQTMHGVTSEFIGNLLGRLPTPDITFVMRAALGTLRTRRARSEDAFDSIEHIPAEFTRYEELVRDPPSPMGRIHVLDAQQSTPNLALAVIATIDGFDAVEQRGKSNSA